MKSHKICIPLPLVSIAPKRTRHTTHTHCIRRNQIRRVISIQKMVLPVLLPKWDSVTNYVIYPLIWPFQGNSQHCIEILTTQPISNFGFDQIPHTKARSTEWKLWRQATNPKLQATLTLTHKLSRQRYSKSPTMHSINKKLKCIYLVGYWP